MASAKEIPPGGEGKINVTFKTTNRKGKVSKSVTVTSNDPQNPRMIIKVSADLEVLFSADKRRIWFNRIKKSDVTAQTVALTGKEIENVEIKDIRLDPKDTKKYGDAISWKLNDKRPQGEKKITLDVTLNPATLRPGRFNSKIIIETNLEKAKLTEIQLAAEILGPLTVVPPRIYYSNYEPGIVQTKEVKIESNEGVEFRILDASIPSDLFTIEPLDKKPALSHTIKVQFHPDNQDRAKALLTIKTDSKEQPELEVNVHGYKKREKSPAGTRKINSKKMTDPSVKNLKRFDTEKQSMSRK